MACSWQHAAITVTCSLPLRRTPRTLGAVWSVHDGIWSSHVGASAYDSAPLRSKVVGGFVGSSHTYGGEGDSEACVCCRQHTRWGFTPASPPAPGIGKRRLWGCS
jgi:hypothetical protein